MVSGFVADGDVFQTCRIAVWFAVLGVGFTELREPPIDCLSPNPTSP